MPRTKLYVPAGSDAGGSWDAQWVALGESPVYAPAYSDTVLADNPTAYWKLDEASGTTATDEMGTHHGTYVGSPTLGKSASVDGTAVGFDGVDDSIDVNSAHTVLESGSWTMEAWAKTTGTAIYSVMAGGDNTSNSFFNAIFLNAEHIVTNDPNDICLHILNDSTSALLVANTAGEHHDGNWHHYAATYDGTTCRLYFDGSEVASDTPSAGMPDLTHLTIGALQRSSRAQYFSGDMDEAAIYNSALSAARVQAHYEAGL